MERVGADKLILVRSGVISLFFFCSINCDLWWNFGILDGFKVKGSAPDIEIYCVILRIIDG